MAGQTDKAPAKVELPHWAEAVRRKYLGGEASMFVLHRNVFDQVLANGRLWPLPEFLAHVLLWDNKEQILLYDAATGIRALKQEAGSLGQSAALGQALLPTAALPADEAGDALARIELQLMAPVMPEKADEPPTTVKRFVLSKFR